MELNKRNHDGIMRWIAGLILAIGVGLILAGEFIHAKGLMGIALRTFVTMGIALLISAAVTLFVD